MIRDLSMTASSYTGTDKETFGKLFYALESTELSMGLTVRKQDKRPISTDVPPKSEKSP